MNLINLNLRRSPRWLIILIDVFISAVALLLAYEIRYNFNLSSLNGATLRLVFVFVLSVELIAFIMGRTYAGIIRYTSAEDSARISIVLLMSSLFFVFINHLSAMIGNGAYLLPDSVIAINFFISTFLLLAFRFLVKKTYTSLLREHAAKVNVIIYGVDELASLTAQTMRKDSSKSSYNIVAFVTERKQEVNNKLLGVRIHHIDSLQELTKNNDIGYLVIARKSITQEEKQSIIETCLDIGLRITSVPEVDKWINGELSVNQLRKVKIEELLERPPINLDKKKISEQISNEVVLVTGAAGSIGSEIVRQVVKFNPKKLILFDQAESPLYDIELELLEKSRFKNFEIIIGSVTNKNRVWKVFETFKPKVVYHAAAYKHVPMMENNPSEAIFNNIMGTKMIADAAVEFEAEKFVMVSTDKAVNPTNVMGASKRIAEIYTQTRNKDVKTRFVTTRFGNVLGSNGSVIPRFRSQIESGGPITVTHPEITRFFMTIPEACQLVLEAGAMGTGGEIFIFDMGKSVKIVDLAKKMIKLSGLTLGRDIQIVYSGLRPGEKLYEELLNSAENTQPTHHSKIMVAKVREYKFDEIVPEIDSLIEMRFSGENMKIVKQMKHIVPEFISKNSIYECLDD